MNRLILKYSLRKSEAPFLKHSFFAFATGGRQPAKPTVCYYKLLNISTTASPDEVKEAYYKLGMPLSEIH